MEVEYRPDFDMPGDTVYRNRILLNWIDRIMLAVAVLPGGTPFMKSEARDRHELMKSWKLLFNTCLSLSEVSAS